MTKANYRVGDLLDRRATMLAEFYPQAIIQTVYDPPVAYRAYRYGKNLAKFGWRSNIHIPDDHEDSYLCMIISLGDWPRVCKIGTI